VLHLVRQVCSLSLTHL
jgi:hypothetical protein